MQTQPTERPRLVVNRPGPPVMHAAAKRRFSGDLGLRKARSRPIPAGVLDELRRAIQPLATFAENHPHLCGLIVLVVLGLLAGWWGRANFGYLMFSG